MKIRANEDIEDGGDEVGHEIDEDDVGMMHDDDDLFRQKKS